MTTGGDIRKGINALWDAGDLEREFSRLWADAFDDEFTALNDMEAAPGQPFPYCVMNVDPGNNISRMSGVGPVRRHELHEIPVTFHIHARARSGESRTAVEVAHDMADLVMRVYGGHPTLTPPDNLCLDHGGHVHTQYQTDYCVRTGDDEAEWVISYRFLVDVPRAA